MAASYTRTRIGWERLYPDARRGSSAVIRQRQFEAVRINERGGFGVVHAAQARELAAVDLVLVVTPALRLRAAAGADRGERQVLTRWQHIPGVLVPVQPQAHATLRCHVARAPPVAQAVEPRLRV